MAERTPRQEALTRIWNTRGPHELLEVMAALPPARDPGIAEELSREATDCETVNPGLAERLRFIADGICAAHAALNAFVSVDTITGLAACYGTHPLCWSTAFPRLVGSRLKETEAAGDTPLATALRRALRVLTNAKAAIKLLGNSRPRTYGDIVALCDEEPLLCEAGFHAWLQRRADVSESPEESLEFRQRLEALIHVCRLRAARDQIAQGREGNIVRIPHEVEVLELWFLSHRPLADALPRLAEAVTNGTLSLADALTEAVAIVGQPAAVVGSPELFANTAYLEYALRVTGAGDATVFLAEYRRAVEGARGRVTDQEVFGSYVLRYGKAIVRHWRATPDPIPLLESSAELLAEVLPTVDPHMSPRLKRDLFFTRARLLENLGYWEPERYADAERAYVQGLQVAGAAHETEARGSALTDLANTILKARPAGFDASEARVLRLFEEAVGLLPRDRYPLGRALTLNNFAIFLNESVTGDPGANHERGLALINEAVGILETDPDRTASFAFDAAFRRHLLGGAYLTRGNLLRHRVYGEREDHLKAARDSYLTGLDRLRGRDHQQLRGTLRLNIAHVSAILYEQTEDPGLARDAYYSYAEACELLGPYPVDYAHALIGKASLALDIVADLPAEQLSEDLREIEQAVELLSQVQHSRGLGRALHARGLLFRARSRGTTHEDLDRAAESFSIASKRFAEAGSIADAIQVARQAADVWVTLYRLRHAEEDVRLAEDALQWATRLAEDLWRRFDSLEWRYSVSDAFADVYAELVWCQAVLGRPADDIAIHAVRAKSRELLESVQSLGSRQLHLGSALGAYLDSLRVESRLVELERWQVQRHAVPGTAEGLDDSARALAELRDQRRLFSSVVVGPAATAAEVHSRVAQFLRAHPKTTICDVTVSRWGTVCLIYESAPESAVLESRILLLQLSAGGLEAEVKGTDATTGWQDWYEAYITGGTGDKLVPRGEWRDATRRLLTFLSSRLVAPLVHELGESLADATLLLVPGGLAGLPVHAAGTESGVPLYEAARAFGLLPNLGLLGEGVGGWRLPKKALCLLSDPEADPQRQLTRAPSESAAVATRLAALGADVQLYASVGNERGTEVFRSRGLGLTGTVHIMEEPPARAWCRGHLQEFDHVFYSGHGVRNSSRGPGLVLPDGIFSTDDVLVTAELITRPTIVLSACATAQPQEYAGPEIFSFAACLLRIGARVVVGTLWPVVDRVAETFSDQYYEALEKQPEPLSAFRAAVARLRAETDDPLLWAPFVAFVAG